MFCFAFDDVLVFVWWCFGLHLMMFWPSFDNVLAFIRWCFDVHRMMFCFQQVEACFPKSGKHVSKAWKECFQSLERDCLVGGWFFSDEWKLEAYLYPPFPTLHRNTLWSNALGEMVKSFEVIRMFHRGVLNVIYVIVYVDFSSFFVS